MKNTKTVFAAVLTLLTLGVSMPSASPQQRQVRSADALRETLKRMEQTLTRHGSRSVRGVIKRFDARDFDGCKITYELTPQVAPDHQGFVPFTERTTIDLSTLDSARVVVRAGRAGAASVNIATRGGVRTIESSVASAPHHFGNTTRFGSHQLNLINQAAAEDVRESLIRAIELCGP